MVRRQPPASGLAPDTCVLRVRASERDGSHRAHVRLPATYLTCGQHGIRAQRMPRGDGLLGGYTQAVPRWEPMSPSPCARGAAIFRFMPPLGR